MTSHLSPPARTWALRRALPLLGLALLVLLGVFYILAPVLDLVADARVGIPADHTGTFIALSGGDFTRLRVTTPGVGDYITLLERGYALHELTFGLLFLVIVLVPFRRRQRWAWWALWLVMIANLGYTLTFGVHDPTIFARGLIADIALPVLLLAHVPAFFSRGAGPASAGCGPVTRVVNGAPRSSNS
jgi:hypothetical protein